MLRFNVDALPPRERFETWAALNNQHLDKLRIEPVADHPFTAEICMQPTGAATLALCTGSGFRVGRTRAEVARTSVHCHVASIHVGGTARVRSRHGETTLQTGDLFLLDTMHEFEIGLEQPYRQALFKVPQAWVEARVSRPEFLAGSVVPRDNPIVQLFASYLVAGFDSADRLSPSAGAMYAQHLLDLLAEATNSLPADAPTPVAAHRAALFAQARRLIALRFSDAQLRPDEIARRLGVTTRTLHRIFAAHGETVMKAIVGARIAHAAKLLADPRMRHRTITEIAFACGFSDLTHFGRTFEARMQMTPSQWRRHGGRTS